MKLLSFGFFLLLSAFLGPLKAQLPSAAPPSRLQAKYYKGASQPHARITDPKELPSARTREIAIQMAKLRPPVKNENSSLSAEERRKKLPSNSRLRWTRPKPKQKPHI